MIPTSVLECKDWKENIRSFVTSFKSDLPMPKNVEAELDQWEIFWKNQSQKGNCLLTTIATTLTTLDERKGWFPNLYRVMCLVAVVPASSNACERSISKLRLIKTYLRSTMRQERLSNLALINIHREIELIPEVILDIFAIQFSRRLELVDILNLD